jgi:hypothetical protein
VEVLNKSQQAQEFLICSFILKECGGFLGLVGRVRI